MDRSKTPGENELGETEFRNSGNQCRSGAALLPIMAAVFIAFIVIGLAIPVLPLHVHQGLGLGTFLVGLVAGSQLPLQSCRGCGQAGMRTREGLSTPSSSG